jgi:hypothetical protein
MEWLCKVDFELPVSDTGTPGGRLVLHRHLRLEFQRWRHHW